jgi:hypothetical protein
MSALLPGADTALRALEKSLKNAALGVDGTTGAA